VIVEPKTNRKSMGDGIKKPTQEEEENKKVARRSIVAMVDIPEGVTITKEMLDIKRLGIGIESKYLDMVIGKRTKEDINSGELITFAKLL